MELLPATEGRGNPPPLRTLTFPLSPFLIIARMKDLDATPLGSRNFFLTVHRQVE